MKKIRFVAAILFFVMLGSVCTAFQKQTTVADSDFSPDIKKLGKLAFGRAAHTTSVMKDGKILIAGGMLENGAFYDTAEMFDPETNMLATIDGRMTKKRVSHTATRLNDGRVLIVGGWSNRNAPEDTAEVFDPKTSLFTPVSRMKSRRSGHTATLSSDGKVILIGGTDGSELVKEIEVYDPLSGLFKITGNLNIGRESLTATSLQDGRILIAGGKTKSGSLTNSLEIFDPKTGRSSAVVSKMASARHKHDAVRLKDGSVLILGGSGVGDFRERIRLAEIFEPKGETIKRTGDLLSARFKINGTSVLLNDGNVLVAGGNEQPEIFDQKTKQFRKVTGKLGVALHFASVTLLNDGRALIVGGYRYGNGSGPVSTDQIWVYAAQEFNGGKV